MHIMEGFLPVEHAMAWTVIAAPFVVFGTLRASRAVREQPETRMLLATAGAFTFLLSALKLPSVTGSSSHPTGTGLGTVLFGPSVMVVPGFVVLVFQALLLAHGGVTTLGANTFSLAVVGPWGAAIAFTLARRARVGAGPAVFLAAAVANWLTYMTTSVQLALAFPDPITGFKGSLAKFAGVFALTQLPLAVGEGLLTVLVFRWLGSAIPARCGEGLRAAAPGGER